MDWGGVNYDYDDIGRMIVLINGRNCNLFEM